jgi:DNA polymerase-1
MIPIHELIGADKTMAQVEIGKVTEYACEDADATLQIYERLAALLGPSGHRQLFEDVEMPFLLALVAMEERGIPIDPGRLESLCEEGKERLQGLAEELFALAGETFDLGSPAQIRRILKERLEGAFPRTRGGQLSLKRESLQAIADIHPLVPKLLKFLDWRDLLQKRIPIFSSRLDRETCRLRLSVHPAATGTGGFRMSRFFNLPGSDAWDDRLRSLVSAPRGFSLLEGRYLRLEDRFLAHWTQDPTLCKYLQSEGSSSPPEMRHLKQQLIKEAKRKGEVRTLLGRIRKIHQLNDPNPALRQAAEREALTTILQGSIADLLKLSAIRLHKALRRDLPESHLIFIEPDGLLVEVRDGQEAHASELLRQAMEGAFSLSVPLKVQLQEGIRWHELR